VPRKRCTIRGFTLIEIMVALTLGSVVALFAHRIFLGVTDGTHRLSEAREQLDRAANARRWLEQAFESLVVGDGGWAFDGDSNRVVFGAWQQTAQGRLGRQRLRIQHHDTRLVALLPSGDSLVLADSAAEVNFDYLLATDEVGDTGSTRPAEAARFLRGWSSPIAGPVAIRLRITYLRGRSSPVQKADTLLFVVGPRG
jgi:prepilin-type N-terminal cleavage/methylation domain-containing protein